MGDFDTTVVLFLDARLASQPRACPNRQTEAEDHRHQVLRTTGQPRSTPNPKVCAACRAGVGEHTEAHRTNPHQGCDFAADAPIWLDPVTRKRVEPDDFSETWFATACVQAGLTTERLGFKPTPKLLRATGATMLLAAGVPAQQVARMGRWANVEVLLNHYHRMRESSRADAAHLLDAFARVELGLDSAEEIDPESRVRFLVRRVEVLEQQLAERDAFVKALGFDPDELGGIQPADVRRRAENNLSDIDKIRELAKTCANRACCMNRRGNLCRSW